MGAALRGELVGTPMDMPRVLSLPERLAHDPTLTGAGVCAAFIDVGFYAHPDLVRPSGRLRAFVDVTRDNARSEDLYEPTAASWHGTMAACCAAGNGWLSGGRYRGLAPDLQVVLIKAGDDGRLRGKYVKSALEVPLRHPELGIRLLNVSVGVDLDDPDAKAVDEAVEKLTAAGVTVFAAAGNDPSAGPLPPASSHAAIALGGLDDRNTPTPLDDAPWPSSHGKGKPDLLALATRLPAPMIPGTIIAREATPIWQLAWMLEETRAYHELALTRGLTPETDDVQTLEALQAALADRIRQRKYIATNYQHVDGTSFAAPIALSVAAQMLEASPSLTPDEIRAGLIATARPLPATSAEIQGAGALHPLAATEWARAHHVGAAKRGSSVPPAPSTRSKKLRGSLR